MGRRIRQKLTSLGRILAFDAQSPTGSWRKTSTQHSSAWLLEKMHEEARHC